MNPEIPPNFLAVLHAGHWRHPGDEALRLLVPFLRDPMDFLESEVEIGRESFSHLADHPHFANRTREYRSSKVEEYRDLPWRDVERSIIVAVNRNLGDDVAIALDWRTSIEDPRVIATDWVSGGDGCHWREVADRLSTFVAKLDEINKWQATEAQPGATDNPDDAQRLREDH